MHNMPDVPALPPELSALLAELKAPPRLEAHLRLVLGAAEALLQGLAATWPQLAGTAYDPDLVRFGAASHDIGKAVVPAELRAPGHAHEPAGERLLRERGYAPAQARFCISHAAWEQGDIGCEDLLVALADKIWKGKREPALERRLVKLLALRLGEPEWQVFTSLDDLIAPIAAQADSRLDWQNRHGLG